MGPAWKAEGVRWRRSGALLPRRQDQGGRRSYCETDVVGTYQVWLRYELRRHTEPACVARRVRNLGAQRSPGEGETHVDSSGQEAAERTRDKLSLLQLRALI